MSAASFPVPPAMALLPDIVDLLADAPLTLPQRQAVEAMQTELVTARARLAEAEARLLKLEGLAAETLGADILLSRPDFNREVARMLAFDERYGGHSSVIYFDVPGLAYLAETLGSEICARLTAQIGQVMARNVRGCDIVGRLAAEEYGVLLARCDNFSAWRKAEAIAVAVRPLLQEFEGHRLELDIAYGAYTFADNKSTVSAGLKTAASHLAADRRHRGGN